MPRTSLAQLTSALTGRFPGSEPELRMIDRLDSAVETLPRDRFYEPVSILDKDAKGQAKLVNVDGPMLNAWAKHMAYSMRSRLRSLEPGVLRELADGSSLVASTLLRAHLEASAMAALSIETLNASRATGELEQLRTLIPQTLFGTAFFAKATKDERIQNLLTFGEQRTITISKAIEALESFAYGPRSTGSMSFLYALLCESTHPNNRGTKPFVQVQDVEPEGWLITYTASEFIEAATADGLLRGLVRSMKLGYAATEMLRVAEFSDGPTPYAGLAPAEVQRIWAAFLADQEATAVSTEK